jgi:REP element-mobilizing transposase RayT
MKKYGPWPIGIRHNTLNGASRYHITFALADRHYPLTELEREIVIEVIYRGSPNYYELDAAVVMPDHVHVLMFEYPDVSRSRVVGGIKRRSAAIISRLTGRAGGLWQKNWHERRIHSERVRRGVVEYIKRNPRKGQLGTWEFDGTLWIHPRYRSPTTPTAYGHIERLCHTIAF